MLVVYVRRLGPAVTVAVLSLLVATLAVAYLQDGLGVPNPSSVYLVAVVLTALVAGTMGAIATSVAAFLLYNYFFTEPRHTFAMSDSGVWLSVVVLLFVGIVVGQLAASMRSRAETGRAREREARALFRLSRALATRSSTGAALPEIAAILGSETQMERVRIALSAGTAERVVAGHGHTADDANGHFEPELESSLVNVLQRTPGDEPARWVRVHRPTGQAKAAHFQTFRVRIEVADSDLGSIWASRPRALRSPDRTETRLLSAAADQIGQALLQDRFAAESRAAEVARQSDALKSALLQSVSHDLRSPLATIRAAAGTLRSDSLEPAAREGVEAIEREAEYLNRVVTNLLDLSRIEAGAVRIEIEAIELEDVLTRSIERLRPGLNGRQVNVRLEAPPVAADPVLLDQTFTNILENVVRHTPERTEVSISAGQLEDDYVRITIEDAGPGVARDALPRLFDKFYRAPTVGTSGRVGTGIGLAVVRGFVEAVGGNVTARASGLGGLAVDVDLRRADVPAQLRGG
jgi:two-component system sensor histidine kinase KdpD